MAREDVIKEIKNFMEKWHMEDDIQTVTFEEIPDKNSVIVKGSSKLYYLVHDMSYATYFNKLPRDVMDIVLEEHPEIMQEFEEEYEELEHYHEEYGFPSRIEFDSEEEYQKLKEQFLYEEREKFLKNYGDPFKKYQVGDAAIVRLEHCIEKHGFNIMYDYLNNYTNDDWKNMIIFLAG